MEVKIARTKPLKTKKWEDLNFSQEKISGFNLEKYQKSKVLLIGAGAIGSNVSLALIRKGIGALDIFDDDFLMTPAIHEDTRYFIW